VRIFFVISGFLITYLLIAEQRQTGAINLPDFYIRRALRIFPAYYLFLTVLGLLYATSLYGDAGSSWLGALTYTRNMVGQGRSATVHLWSLSIEEQFYLLWPATLVIIGLCSRSRLALFILMAIAGGAIVARTVDCSGETLICLRALNPKFALRYADSLAVGCGGAFLYDKASLILPSLPRPLRVGLLYGSVTAMCTSTALVGPATNTLQAVMILGVVFLSMSEQETLIFRVLNSKPLVYLGMISYSLYLWHVVFLTHYMGNRIEFPANHTMWWMYALGLAALSYIYVERPIRNWGRRTLSTSQGAKKHSKTQALALVR
jgi:peptidoglycan/LPS O-acetylase OafA/YrhL